MKSILSYDLLEIEKIDLSLINPLNIIKGFKKELEILILCLILLAKKNGIIIIIVKESNSSEMINNNEIRIDNEDNKLWNKENSLPIPIQPDKSFSPNMNISTFLENQQIDSNQNDSISSNWLNKNNEEINFDNSMVSDEFDPFLTPIHQKFIQSHRAQSLQYQENNLIEDSDRSMEENHEMTLTNSQSHSMSKTISSSSSGKTVLQLMLEEFGLNPG
ncbi:uncharacterized protein I206_101695 [Kwoniella pini CBS 10737]|uniref:Uncharacterized protein n=1 Tax=Kwoniella pini CBS 10737 TaxID=1296096 RepID=A0AAJ8L1G9_9TREE